MKGFLKKYLWIWCIFAGGVIGYMVCTYKNLTKEQIKDIAWADWFGTAFSALAFIYLALQVKLQKDQFNDQKEYNRSMATFELVKKSGDKMRDVYDEYFISQKIYRLKEDEEQRHKLIEMHNLINYFITYCVNYCEKIQHDGVKEVFQKYAFNKTNTPGILKSILPREFLASSGKDVLAEKLKDIKYNKNPYILFFVLFYPKEHLKNNEPWLLHDLCEHWIKDEIKTGKLFKETNGLQYTKKWLEANTVDKNGWFGKD